MKLFVRQWLVLVLGWLAVAAHASDLNAIDVSGQQRMLSQRIVKAWCQIGLNVQPELSRKQLDASIRRFEDNLRLLEQEPKTSKTKSAFAGVKAAWEPLRRAATGVIRQSDAEQLNLRAEDVLLAAERLTHAFQDQTILPVGRWVNLAGRQRMLSQRLVKLYMLQQWDVNDSALREEIERVQNEFSGALENMQQHATQPLLSAELGRLALQWEWIQTVLATEGAESFRLIMAEGGELVLLAAENIVSIYQKRAQ